jgi:hypothetical protein
VLALGRHGLRLVDLRHSSRTWTQRGSGMDVRSVAGSGYVTCFEVPWPRRSMALPRDIFCIFSRPGAKLGKSWASQGESWAHLSQFASTAN